MQLTGNAVSVVGESEPAARVLGAHFTLEVGPLTLIVDRPEREEDQADEQQRNAHEW